MKKLIITLAISIGFFLLLPAQEVTFSVISSNEKSISLRIDFPEMELQEVDVEGEIMHKILMKEAFPVAKLGAPELLKSTKSIIIPDGAKAVIRDVNVYSETIENFELAPSRGAIYRNQNPSEIPYIKGNEYQEDVFYPSEAVELNDRYMLRDFAGSSLSCYAYSYNPVKKELRRNRYLTVRIDFEGDYQPAEKKLAQEFIPIYESHFLNFTPSRYTTIHEEGDLLIIAPEAYVSALEPLREWKIKNGIRTEIVTKESIGSTSAAIKNYITSYYQNEEHNLVFVLLVGDKNNMPSHMVFSSYENQIQDNYYTEVAGGDTYPDLFLGRFLASSLSDVMIQVEKTIAYESNPPETSHFPRFCGIASEEGPGDNNEYDYQHIQVIHSKLRNFTYDYNSGYELFEGSRGGLDAAGYPTAALLSNAVNSGVGIINYAGHGDWNLFFTSNFSNNHIDALTNSNKLPFIISVACQNGNYGRTGCFAQKWLLATKNGEHTGAIATVMSSINQAWNPPMAGQDEMNRVLVELDQEAKRTFGGICFNGFLKMLDSYDGTWDYGSETYRTWLIFGDPSLAVRTAVPDIITAIHPDTMHYGVDSVNIACDIEGAKVVLSHHDTILGQGIVENGTITFSDLDTVPVGDTLYVLASKFNHIPYQGEIIVKNSRPSGLPKNISEMDIRIYPNPATNQVTIQFYENSLMNSVMHLYDVYGRLLLKNTIRQTTENVSIESLSPGLYILEIRDGDKAVKNFKLIKN